MEDVQGTGRALRIGLVELPDDLLDIMSHFTQGDDSEVLVVISQDSESYAVRMAEILHVPVMESPNRLSLLACTHIIVGPQPENLVAEIRELMDGTFTQVLTLREAMRRFGLSGWELDLEPELGPMTPVDEAEPSEPVPVPPEKPVNTVVDSVAADDPPVPAMFATPAPVAEAPEPEPSPDVASEPEAEPSPFFVDANPSGIFAAPPIEPTEVRETVEEAAPELPAATPEPVATPEPASPPPAEPAGPPRRVRVFLNEHDVSRPMSEELIILQPGQSPPPADAPAGAGGNEAAHDDAGLGSRFRLGSLFGEDLRNDLGSLSIDESGGDVLGRILDIAIRAAHAETGSIMLLDEDGRHLRIVAAKGLSEDVMGDVRERIGQGMAGEVFTTREPRLIRGRIGPSGDARPESYDSAVVPILSGGKAVGVLSVNASGNGEPFSERTVLLLARFAQEASAAILKAVDLGCLPPEKRQAALLSQLERIMSLEESLVNRLRSMAEAVRKAFRAEFAHLFLVDPVGSRLELISPARSLTQPTSRFSPLHRGLFSWVVERGCPQAMPLWDEKEGKGVAMLLLPIVSDQPFGLLVLEQVPLSTRDEIDGWVEFAGFIIQQAADLLALERSIGSGELFSELRLRIVDQSARLVNLLPHERARATLEFAVDLLAAETAVWCPDAESRPLWVRPSGNLAVRLQADFRPHLDAIAEAVRSHNRIVSREPGAAREDLPPVPAPFLGTRVGTSDGVFLLIFPPDEEGGALAQAPSATLIDAMVEIGELLPEGLQSQSGIFRAA